VEPARNRIPFPDGVRLAGEQEKGGLEDIFRILFIALDAAANLEHHRPMSLEQGDERRLLPLGKEEFQELAVARFVVGVGADHCAELLQDTG
jgi:hypothetical protein